MTDISYNDVKYRSFDAIGKFVLIEKLQKPDFKKIGDIYIPESEKYKNQKMGVGIIRRVGKEAQEEYNVNVGDYVLYDYYSAHGDNKDSIITNAENLILQLTKEEAYKFINGDLI